MEQEEINYKVIKSFCKEFQAVWLIKLSDLTMSVYSANMMKSIPNSIDTATLLNSYENSRKWYIENYVVDYQKERILKQSEIANVLACTENGEPYFIEYDRKLDGVINLNQLLYDRINNENGEPEYILFGFRDIDVRKKAEVDDLTGVLTRQVFFLKAEELLLNNPNQDFDLVISDIVDFKKINETYGVSSADNILKWAGSLLSPYISDDFLIGRYGGDQFVMLAKHEDISQRITGENLEVYYQIEKSNGLPEIITKFGVYEYIDHKKSIVSICDKAMLALNSIKDQYDKKVAYYDEKIKIKVDKQRRIENSMYDSMQNGDFKVYYQPKHDALSGKLVGAEALVRWIHPVYGFMPPGDFIPLFEKNGFVVENDRFVWKRTCENLRRWQNLGLKPVPISINASKLSIASENLFTSLQEPVVANDISPQLLHIEVTETLMADDVEELKKKLSSLRSIGYQIELDDFGSGFSSLNVLSTLPLDVVKLDMSFMQQFGDEKRIKVLEACINLAKNLGYKTVSEGVERAEQRELLGRMGVDVIQGYFYSKPLSEDEFESYLLKHCS